MLDKLAVLQAALTGRSLLVANGLWQNIVLQVPAVLRQGVSVVVSLLKALMSEQVSSLLRRKIPSSFISDIGTDGSTLATASWQAITLSCRRHGWHGLLVSGRESRNRDRPPADVIP